MADLPQGSNSPFEPPELQSGNLAVPQLKRDLPVGSKTPFAVPMTTTPSVPDPEGMTERGNIDLQTRPIVHNQDGSVSSVYSGSFNHNGQEVLVPLVADGGKILTMDQAQQDYLKNGKHLGKFASPEAADKYAQLLHEDYAAGKIKGYPAVDKGYYPGDQEAGRDVNRIHQGISRGFHQ